MRKKFLVRFFLTVECATSIFGAEVVNRSARYRFFKKNLRVRVEDLLEIAELAGVPLTAQSVAKLMDEFPDRFKDQALISPSDIAAVYYEFRQTKLNQLSEVSFLSGVEIAYLLHCGACSVYCMEGFPESVREGIFQVKRWSTKTVLDWAEKSVHVPSQELRKKSKKKNQEKREP